MSTPERSSARPGLSRRNYEQQQRSPFHRAYLESHSRDRLDASQVPDPVGEIRTRRRRNLSQSGTLRGAFEAVSRYPTMSGNITTDTYTLGTPNRRKQSLNRISPQSNPPNELAETYRQIDDAGSLVDQDDDDFRFPMNRSRDNQSMRSSSGSRTRVNSLFSSADADFLNEVTDESLRRTLTDHIKDEQRLKRATANRSPMLSKAGTATALTSENLQRRDEEDQDVFEEEEEDHLRPSLNVPLNWGSRGTHRRDWLRNITRRTESESGQTEEERKEASPPESKPELRSRIGLEDRNSGANRTVLGEPSFSRYNRVLSSGLHKKLSPERKTEDLGEGSQIPNTPIMVYKNSTFSKRSPTKRDSCDLLRKLSRTESPPQAQAEFRTPENPKLPERRIYDKTPVVTGAWIDTPLTERMTELPKPRLNNLKPSTSVTKDTGVFSEAVIPPITEEPNSSEPHQDKSALETVMQDFKADKDSLDVGDDTLESLQEILNEKPSDLKTEAESDAEYEKTLMQKFERQSKDGVNHDSMDKTLKSLAENMDDVKKGIHGLEKQVARDAAALASIPTSPRTNGKSSSNHTCDSCNTCRAHHYESPYAIYLPRLWKRDVISQRVRPTPLGWCSALLLLWYFSESTMCDYYCHPFVAEVCEGNCLLPDAPRFPFVIPIMLWRWLHLSALWTPLWAVTVAFFRFITQLLGISDGYVDDTLPRALNLSGEIRIRGTRVAGFPAFATSKNDFGAPQKQRQSQNAEPTPVAVPELNLGQQAPQEGKGDWEDDSMDDDELI
ncbi:hypothetical protein BBP40_001765 [Aspergillus hancockii]|nr:hypothetical protein BBP40_001765 [Aspergillus hancockii]